MLRHSLTTGAIAVALLHSSNACAQANANAVTTAGDAFGFRNGDEAVGIYDETSVRGFSLEAAGNYRVNGTYFVRNSGVSAFFVEDTTVRIGYNTLATALPGPSGVVDYRLRDPVRGEKDALTLGLDFYGQPYLEAQVKHRSADERLSYSVGLGRVFDVRDGQGGRGGASLLLAGTGRLTIGSARVQPFFGEYQYTRPGTYRVVPIGDDLPPRLKRGLYLGQSWAMEKGQRRIAGVLLDVGVKEKVGVGLTAAFAQEDPTRGFTQILDDLKPDGTYRASMIAVPQQRSTAWSGELRAHLDQPLGRLQQRFGLTLRGRVQRARIGGAQLVELGRLRPDAPAAQRPAPELEPGVAINRDEVDQWGVGATWRASLGERLRANAGVLRTDYRKTFEGGDGVQQGGGSRPWLYNAGVAWRATSNLEAYGSYSRGLEEAGVAPATASNRNQVLPAIVVTQRELGIRYVPGGGVAVVVAAFDTRKPYAGIVGAGGAFGFLGSVRHRGIEGSLSGRLGRGTSVVIGGVLLDARLNGDRVDAGSIGEVPVAVPSARAIASVDHKVGAVPGLSIDAGMSFASSRVALSVLRNPDAKQVRVEAISTLNLGLRYGVPIGGAEMVIRAQVQNLLDQYSWEVNSSETLTYSAPRRFRLVLTTLL